MPTYNVHVIIENKPGISDPEGDTILNDLVLRGKNSSVKKISFGKILKFTIIAKKKKTSFDCGPSVTRRENILYRYGPIARRI